MTILASRWAGPTGRVIAFEALPRNSAIIHQNLSLNNITNAEVRNIAAGSRRGQVHVEYKKFGFLYDSNGTIRMEPHSGTMPVEVRTLDTELEGITPTVLKIDVEGHEIEVLKGAKRILASRPAIDLEVHVSNFDDPARAVKEIYDLLSIDETDGYFQPHPDANLEAFDRSKHTPAYVSTLTNVHLLLKYR